jgi:1-acyl-sn-glycerol-3-phosphate acyltransferase
MIARIIKWLLVGSARFLVGGRPEWQGSGQRIFVANHSSHLDTVMLLSTLPKTLRRRTRPVAAADYWTHGLVRRYLIHSIFRGVLVDRGRWCLKPLEPLAKALRAGDSLILFPEGTRGTGGNLQQLKPGLFHVARAFPHVEIVPAWIDMPRGLTFGPPLRWTDGQQQEEFMSEVREALEALQP